MWLIHFPLNNILIFIFPLFFFLFYLHETDNDLQTADLERKPGPATYKGPGNPWSHFPSVLLKRKKKCQWLSSVFIICCQKNNLNTLFWAFYWKVFFDKFLEIFISQNSMANSVTFCEHCGFRNISFMSRIEPTWKVWINNISELILTRPSGDEDFNSSSSNDFYRKQWQIILLLLNSLKKEGYFWMALISLVEEYLFSL